MSTNNNAMDIMSDSYIKALSFSQEASCILELITLGNELFFVRMCKILATLKGIQYVVETSTCGTRASPLCPIWDSYPDRITGYSSYQLTLLTAEQ